MTRLTPALLVVLRLAIGWHLLFAGVEKLRKDSWSSEGYLREASGPLAPAFRELAGDPLVDQLTLLPIPANADLTRESLQQYLPPALAKDWDAYFEQFVQFYHLDDQDRERARAKLEQQKDQTARWLLSGTRKVRKISPSGSAAEVELTTPQRLKEYQEKVAELRRLEREEIAPVEGTIYQELVQKKADTVKAEINRMRADLRADLNAQTARMKSALKEVLTAQQLEEYGDMPEPPRSRWLQWRRWTEWTRLDWTDALVVVGLLTAGVLLLVGLFTRFACLLGAFLLLLFYLPAMPLPGIPESLRTEGYPFINKNIIEMLALLMLATTSSGRWVGLDGLVQFLNPRRRQRQPPPAPRGWSGRPAEVATVAAEPADPGGPVSMQPPIRRDTSHGH
ncbi:MAG TPA: hypothetical protein VNK04_08360 [Gemmataceae bacterium]|nr:hypothetical protein [Gemmataceae bacterium]